MLLRKPSSGSRAGQLAGESREIRAGSSVADFKTAAASEKSETAVMRLGMVLAISGLSLAATAPGPVVLGAGLFLTGLAI